MRGCVRSVWPRTWTPSSLVAIVRAVLKCLAIFSFACVCVCVCVHVWWFAFVCMHIVRVCISCVCPICVAANLDTTFSCGHRACDYNISFTCVFVCICVHVWFFAFVCIYILCVFDLYGRGSRVRSIQPPCVYVYLSVCVSL
jgi:hypothetical protein